MRSISIIYTLLSFCTCAAFAQKKASINPSENQPFILGVTASIHSIELGETRVLNIYLPEGYSPDSSATYPVIYLLDGSADEDFIHIAGLVQYCNFPWVNILPKSIVVGIANVDRRRDFTFPTTIEADKKSYPTTGKSMEFIAFMEKELQPYIEANYKTNGHKTIIGQSLGGLLATEILIKKPLLFRDYIIISPSLWWDKESLLSVQPAIAPAQSPQKTRIYIGVGKEGEIMKKDARRLYRKFKALKDKNIEIRYEYLSREDHATIFHLAVYNAFKTMRS
ncbi:MAG: Ferri-bacillibactin esterase BesA [Saprospiraceae bacterium]|nr:Ferri-bacillibactin esterase BesA [Saprospiraceae bacterium]